MSIDQGCQNRHKTITVKKAKSTEGSEGNTTSGTVMTLSISSAIAFADEIPCDLHCFDKRNCLSPVSNLNKRFSRLRT